MAIRKLVDWWRISGNDIYNINSANVGIGTTNPTVKLQVGIGNPGASISIATINSADVNTNVLVVSNWDGAATTYGPRFNFDNSGWGNFFIGGSDGSNNFDIARTWGTPDFRIDTNGDVGIGTSSPSAKLTSYKNDATLTPLIRAEQAGTGDAALGFRLTGVIDWVMGLDNSDSDKFKISASSESLGGGVTVLTIQANGAIIFPSTITAVGTTGNQTINQPAGRVNIAASGTTVTVTNSLVTANSIVLVVVATADATATVKSVVPGAGSFVITSAAVTAETAFSFLVVS